MNHLPQAIHSDCDVESPRLPRLILSVAAAPDARSALVAHSDVLRESGYSFDQVIGLIRRMRKKACVTVGDKITFVMEFVLQGMGTNLQITKAIVDEFYDDKPTDDHVKQLKRTVASALSNYHRFKLLEPRVPKCLPVWKLDPTSRGCKSSDRAQRNRAIVASTRNLSPELIRELYTSQPYSKSVRLHRSSAQDISPVDAYNDIVQAPFVTIDTPSPSPQTEADTDLPQSLLGTVHNAHTLMPTSVFSSPWTDGALTLCSSPSFAGTRSAEKGKLLQLPLLSPAMTLTTIAEPNATPAVSPSIFSPFSETSPIPLDQPEEWYYEALISDFDRAVESRPGSPSLPCTAPTLQQIRQVPAPSLGLGMELIPLDELSRFDDPSFTVPDFDRPSPSFEGSGLLNHPAVHEEGAVPSLQLDEWLHGSSASYLPGGTQKSDGPISLDPSQLLTFDQIMSLILGEPPIDPSSSETAELGNPPLTLPPYPGQTITPGRLKEDMEAEADFAEYLRTWFQLD